MRRHWTSYIKAFFDIRHANIDIEVSKKNDGEQVTVYYKMHKNLVFLKKCSYFRYHIGSASLVIFSFAFMIFLIY